MPVVMCALLVSSQAAQAPALRWSSCIIWFMVKIIIIVGMGIFMTALRTKKKKYNQILNKRPHLTFTVHCLLCDCLLAAFSNLEVLCFIQQRNTKETQHWITKAHELRIFCNFARKKIVYTHLTTLYWSIRNSSVQLTSTQVVLYIVARRPFWQVIHF